MRASAAVLWLDRDAFLQPRQGSLGFVRQVGSWRALGEHLQNALSLRSADVLQDFSNRNEFQFSELNRIFVTYFTLNGRLVMEVYRVELADGRILPAKLRIRVFCI